MKLPASFASNTHERMIQFLNESNRIESIKEVDYHDPAYQVMDQGHFGALVDSQRMAVERKPLTMRKIMHWQSLLTREQVGLGHPIEEKEIGHIRSYALPKNVRVGCHVPPDYSRVPTLLEHLIEQINETLEKEQEKLKDDVEYCKFLGRSFQQFESIHPFADGNGRTGRIVAAYIATYCRRPVIVFNSEMSERNRYYDAHVSAEAMARFMAKKTQEAIFGFNQQILYQTHKSENATQTYRSEDGTYQETYQWHSLLPLIKPEETQKVEVKKSSHSPYHFSNLNKRKIIED